MRGLLLAALLLPAGALARTPPGPGWGYVEGGYLGARLQSDEKGNGAYAALNLPLSEYWMAVGNFSKVDAEFTSPSAPITERYRTYGGALGLHDNWGRAHGYATLGYAVAKRHTDFVGTPPREDNNYGAVLTMGVRILAQPWLEIEPQGTIADFGATLKFKLGLRVLPHVWLVGGYSADTVFADTNGWTAGLRISLEDATRGPVKPRGAAPVDAGSSEGEVDAAWAPAAGEQMQVLRAIRLQVRPRFGAPETAVVARGALLTLLRDDTNDFGRWWYVAVDGKEGWLRESELLEPAP